MDIFVQCNFRAYKYPKSRCQEDRSRLIPVVPSKRTRGNRHKLKHRIFHLSIRKKACLLWGWQNSETGSPEKLWSLLLQRHSKPTQTWSCATCCRWALCVGQISVEVWGLRGLVTKGDGWPCLMPSSHITFALALQLLSHLAHCLSCLTSMSCYSPVRWGRRAHLAESFSFLLQKLTFLSYFRLVTSGTC